MYLHHNHAVPKIGCLALALLGMILASGLAEAAEIGRAPLVGTALVVVVETAEPAPPLNKIFTLKLTISAPKDSPEALSQSQITDVIFDARMPAHNHGMLTKPRVQAAGEKIYIVEGVKFHMPGAWELYVSAQVSGTRRSAVIPLKL